MSISVASFNLSTVGQLSIISTQDISTTSTPSLSPSTTHKTLEQPSIITEVESKQPLPSYTIHNSCLPIIKSSSGRHFLEQLPVFGYDVSRVKTKSYLPHMKGISSPHLFVLWGTMHLALGAQVRGEVIRGLPCITRFNQLFCRGGGTTYPSKQIEKFIDDNKALIRRMYGDFISISGFSDNIRLSRGKRAVEEPLVPHEEFYPSSNFYSLPTVEDNTLEWEGSFPRLNVTFDGFEMPYVNVIKSRQRRQAAPGPVPKSNRKDVCESKQEVATPYWASNSRGKILAIVNIKEFSQIIHQEICESKLTKRCSNDCGCEQKYKYHRLMAYDPENDCKGIFMDWFLFPSCCSCRCDP